jgi:hypothetical protein
MVALVGIGILLVLFVALGIGVWLAIIWFGKEEDEDFDNPICINFMSDYSDGRFIGVQKYSVLGKDDRRIITISPRDVLIKDVKHIPDVKVIVDKNKLIPLSKGQGSRDKNVNIILPKDASHFPKQLKESMFGKWLMFLTELQNAENSELDAFKEGMARQSAHIKSMGAGELSVERMTQLTEYFDEVIKSIQEAKKKEGETSGFTPPRFGGMGGTQ